MLLGICFLALGIQSVFAEELMLPNLLVSNEGQAITASDQWKNSRRHEVLELFRNHVYGRRPVERPDDLRFETVKVDQAAMEGRATLKEVDIRFSGPGGKGQINVSLFIPNNVPRPVPGFILICNRSPRNIDPGRKIRSGYWPAEEIVQRGYAAAAFHYNDVDPDHHDGFKNGVHGIFDPNEGRGDDAWGAISAWGWGASRVLDYFESDPDIDEKRIGVVGHSRGGKAALWCGAEDERFALVISNNSGCTGASLARRKHGERVSQINKSFPHWFCENYKQYNGKEDELPVDQHMLIALMAPRLVYVASASADDWADPRGEFLSCVHAKPVFDLYGITALGTSEMPAAGAFTHEGHVGYHLREGGHNLTEYDWSQFMNFADRHFGKPSLDIARQ